MTVYTATYPCWAFAIDAAVHMRGPNKPRVYKHNGRWKVDW